MIPTDAESAVLLIPLDAFRRHVAAFNRGERGIGEDEQLKALRAALAVEAGRVHEPDGAEIRPKAAWMTGVGKIEVASERKETNVLESQTETSGTAET